MNKFTRQNFACAAFFKTLIYCCFRSDLDKIWQTQLWNDGSLGELFLFGRSRFTAMLYAHLYQIGKWWFWAQFAERIQDSTRAFIYKWSLKTAPLVCHVLSRFCNLKFASEIKSFKWAKSVIPEFNASYLFIKVLFSSSYRLPSLPLCSASGVNFCICAEFLDTRCSEKSNCFLPEGVPTKARVPSKIWVVMVNFIPCFNFVYQLQCFRYPMSVLSGLNLDKM